MSDVPSEEETRNAYKAFETSREMLGKRGYIVPDVNAAISTYDKYKEAVGGGAKRRSDLSYLAEKPSKESENGMEVDSSEKIWVMFTDERKISRSHLKITGF